jgi:hypothetical protein
MKDTKPIYHFVLWLVWPVMTLYLGIKYIRTPLALPLLSLFCLFFGLTLVINYQGNADSVRYAQEFISLNEKNISLSNAGEYLFEGEEGKVDLYQPLITLFLSNFTSNPKILFAVFGLIFGIFHVKNILMVVNEIPDKIGFLLTTLLLTLVLINPIWSINGVRMWTAAQVFIFGFLTFYLKEEKTKGAIWCTLSVFIHFSFLFPITLFFAYLFIPRRITVLFAFFIISFFVSQLNLDLVRQYVALLPALFQEKIMVYTQEAVVERYMEEGESPIPLSWHVILANNLLRYFIAAILIFLYGRYIYYRDQISPKIITFLGLALFFSAFANLSALIPSGARFLVIGDTMTLVTFIFYAATYTEDRLLNYGLKLISPALLFVIIFKLRVGLDFIGLLTVFGNPILALIFEDNLPIIEFIKSIL